MAAKMNNIQLVTQVTMGETGTATLEGVRRYQLGRLNETLTYCKTRSRFYKKHLSGVLSPLNAWEDFGRIPFTSQEDLREGGMEAFLCVPPGEIRRITTLQTSGSTGKPKRIGFTDEDIEGIIRFFDYGMRELTQSGKKVMNCMPGSRENGITDLLAKAMSRFGAVPLIYGSIADPADAARFVLEQRPGCLTGIPAQILGLAAYMEKHGLNKETCIESVLLSTDYLSESVRNRIERIFNCRIFNHYGSTEMGYGAALECAAHEGMHLREAELYFEIVDPDTGAVLPPGQEGEVVFTTLRRTGMPLVRYRTGDIARFMPDAVCACGSVLPRITGLRRGDDCEILLSRGRVTLQALDEAVFALEGLTDYTVAITRAPKLTPASESELMRKSKLASESESESTRESKPAPERAIFSFTLWTVDGETPDGGEWAAVRGRVQAMIPDQALSVEMRVAAPGAVPPSLQGKRMIEWDGAAAP
ncbi:MAG: AMP-binding protein [Peptococcaceae bacterium]|nr:AMP-binding protein [Peptococcaceae bacterium]